MTFETLKIPLSVSRNMNKILYTFSALGTQIIISFQVTKNVMVRIRQKSKLIIPHNIKYCQTKNDLNQNIRSIEMHQKIEKFGEKCLTLESKIEVFCNKKNILQIIIKI